MDVLRGSTLDRQLHLCVRLLMFRERAITLFLLLSLLKLASNSGFSSNLLTMIVLVEVRAEILLIRCERTVLLLVLHMHLASRNQTWRAFTFRDWVSGLYTLTVTAIFILAWVWEWLGWLVRPVILTLSFLTISFLSFNGLIVCVAGRVSLFGFLEFLVMVIHTVRRWKTRNIERH